MRVFGVLTLALTLPLAGCFETTANSPVSNEQLAARKQELAAKDDETCKGYGAKPGTDPYVQCRIKLDQGRTAPRELKCTTMKIGIGMDETTCR
jgi:hypothetical protein